MWYCTKIEANLYSFQNISWVDFLNINPEIYLSIVILIGLTHCGNCQFFTTSKYLSSKKRSDFSIYSLTKWSLFFTLVFYSMHLTFLEGTLLNFNAYSITDFYTNSLKFGVILTTLIILNASEWLCEKSSSTFNGISDFDFINDSFFINFNFFL